MSVTEVSLMGVGTAFDPGDSWEVGSAVEVAPGLYLTAAHVVYDTVPNPNNSNPPFLAVTPTLSTFAINPNNISFSYDSANSEWTNPVVSGGSAISNFTNINNYAPNLTTGLPGGNDISSFTAASAGTPTGVVLFINPTQATMSQYFPNVSFTGYLPSAISSQGLVTESPITSSGDSIVAVGGNQIFALSGNVGGQGTSGAGVWGTYGGNNYVLGTVLGLSSSGNTVASYITPSEFYSVFPLQGTPSTTTHNLIVGSSSGSEDMRGSFQTTDIIGAGNNNLILAGGNGDTVNPGVGTNNIMFSSTVDGIADSSGTTYVLGAGSNEIDGGSPNDKLVLLADRLSSRSNTDPTGSAISATSPTIQLLGGWGNIPGSTIGGVTVGSYYSLNTGLNAAGANSWNQMDQLLGDYAYDVGYAPGYGSDGKEDLEIDIMAYNLAYNASTGAGGPPILWKGQTLINDYQPGDFGLTFVQSPDYAEAVTGQISGTQYEADQQALTLAQMASPVTPTYVDDDPTVTWLGLDNQGATPSDSASTLGSDLKDLLAATGAPSPQVSVGGFLSNQPVLDAAGDIAILDQAANVSANFDALNADANVTSISLTDSGTPALTLSSSQALDDTTALGKIGNSNYTISVFDTSANVAANFDALNADSRVTAITLTDGPTPVLMLTASQGAADQNALYEVTNANVAVTYTDVSGQAYTSYEDIYVGGGVVAEAQQLSAGGTELYVSGEGVTVSSTSAGTTVSADSTTFALSNSDGVTSAVIYGAGDNVSIDSISVALSNGASATVNGSNDSISLDNNGTLSASGTGDSTMIWGSGDTVTMGSGSTTINTQVTNDSVTINSGSVVLWNASSATINGSENSLTLCYNDTVSTTGTGDSVWIQGTGDSITLSSASVSMLDGSSATVNGSNNSISLGNNDTVSANGTGESVALEGSGDSITISSGSVTVWSGESATVGGNNNSIVAYANDTVSTTGAGDSAALEGSGDSITISSGSATVWNGESATVGGNNNSIMLYANDTISATGSNDSVTVDGTGNSVSVSSASVAMWDGSVAILTGSNNAIVLYNNDSLTGTGTGDSATIEGTNDSVTFNSGSVVLWAGSTVAVTGNNDTVTFAGSNTSTAATASGTGETYQFASGDGQGVIGAAAGTNSGAVAFASSLSDESLWFQQVGNNLQIDVLGTNNTLTVDDWFGGGNAAAVQQFAAGGLKLDSQVSALVSVMASYAANNSSFNPTTATQMPSNSSLQSAIASAWHH